MTTEELRRQVREAQLAQTGYAMNVDPVGLVEIAERLGVERATADQWRARGLLPEPDWTIGGRPAWRWEHVKRWAERTGRIELPPCVHCGEPLAVGRTDPYTTDPPQHDVCIPRPACVRCGEPIRSYSGPVPATHHRACLDEEIAEQNPPRSWRYHIHGENWAGADGTVVARSRQDAERKVLAQYDAPTGVGEVHIGGSDDLGCYVRVWEDAATRSEFDEEIAAALVANRSMLGDDVTIDTDLAWDAYRHTPARWARVTPDNESGSVGVGFVLSDASEPWWVASP